jgi:hypothetical protein
MHTTKDKLSAMVTIWVIITILSVLLCAFGTWALFIVLFCAIKAVHCQDKYNEWVDEHTNIIDIRSLADMDRPE